MTLAVSLESDKPPGGWESTASVISARNATRSQYYENGGRNSSPK